MANRSSKTLAGIYSSSWTISMTGMAVVGALEVFMLIYTVADPALFGESIGQYRIFYISLLTLAIVYLFLNFFVKKGH